MRDGRRCRHHAALQDHRSCCPLPRAEARQPASAASWPQLHINVSILLQPFVAIGCWFSEQHFWLFQKEIQMLRGTLVALTATVALGCLPTRRTLSLPVHSHGGGHVGGRAAGRGGHAHYARGGGHRHFAGRGYGGYGGGGYGYPAMAMVTPPMAMAMATVRPAWLAAWWTLGRLLSCVLPRASRRRLDLISDATP
jgi:hypothetical protein